MRTMNFRFRGLAVAAFALALSGAHAQDLSAKIDVTIKATTLDRFLAALGEKAGVSLLVAPNLRSEVLAAQMTGVTAEEAMTKVAEVTNAAWAREGQAYRLTRLDSVLRQMRAADQKARADGIAKEIAKMSEAVQKQGDFDASRTQTSLQNQMQSIMQGGAQGGTRGGLQGMMQNIQNSMASLPGGRAVVQLVTQMDPAVLASIADGQRVVFSTAPTQMQRPLPSNAQAVVRDFLQNQIALGHAFQASATGVGERNPLSWVVGDPAQQQRLQASQPAKSFLIAQRFGGDNLTLTLIVADAEGNSIATGFMAITPSLTNAPADAPTTDTGEQPVVLSDEARQAAQLFGQITNENNPAALFGGGQVMIQGEDGNMLSMVLGGGQTAGQANALSDEWRTRLLNPEKSDPLSWFVTEGFLGTAKARGLNFIGILPDSVLVPASRMMMRQQMTPSLFQFQMTTNWGMDVREDGTWMVARPKNMTESIDSRVDRAAMGELFRAHATKGMLRLDDIASYALRSPNSGGINSLDVLYSRLIGRNLMGQVFGVYSGQRQALRLFGSLNSSVRQQLAQGQSLVLSTLGAGATGSVFNMTFNSPEGPAVSQGRRRGGNQTETRTGSMGPGGGFMGGMGGANMLFERTEVLPSGIPGGARVTMRVDQQPAVLASESASGNDQVLTAGALGSSRAFAANPELARFNRNMPSYDKYKMITVVTYRITVQLAPNVAVSRTLGDNVVDPRAQAVAYDQLPAEFRAMVDRAQSETAQRMAQEMQQVGERIRAGGGRRGGSGANPSP